MKTQTKTTRQVNRAPIAPVEEPVVETLAKKVPIALQREIAAESAIFLQAGAIRLEMSKKEEQAKLKLTELLGATGLTYFEALFRVNDLSVRAELEMKSGQSSSIDIDKLTKMLTPAQFKQCASVTLKAAKEVLPQSLIDQCLIVTTTPAVLKVKASKGFPSPAIELFTSSDESKSAK